MNKLLKIMGIALAVFFMGGLLFAFLIWYAFGGAYYFSPNPPKPAITYGEFKFNLTYEMNGKTKTVSDTLICKFNGYNVDEGRGKTRRWKEYIKNEHNYELFEFRDEERKLKERIYYSQICIENIGIYKVVLGLDSAEYFLREPEYKSTSQMPYIQVYDTTIGYYKDPKQSNEYLSQYNFKIIDWYCDPPINNTFK